jgi:hypothetical protein
MPERQFNGSTVQKFNVNGKELVPDVPMVLVVSDVGRK